jgi:hypothetical protein
MAHGLLYSLPRMGNGKPFSWKFKGMARVEQGPGL